MLRKVALNTKLSGNNKISAIDTAPLAPAKLSTSSFNQEIMAPSTLMKGLSTTSAMILDPSNVINTTRACASLNSLNDPCEITLAPRRKNKTEFATYWP